MEIEQSESKPPIELLAPAGDFDALKAAIGNGADSVYFGSNYFNARKKAKNIPEEEMEEAIDYVHLRACRAYLTINTLLLDEELPLAVDLAQIAYRFGIDAIIVQDLGFAAFLKKTMPDLALHASTQATIYDEYAIDACACIGFSRIILPRELSIPEIARLTIYAKNKGIETEVFVHGALCVCYSGQCLMSSMIGGRSGNRGECAQPCRLSYDITVGKRPKSIIAPHLATKDLSAVNHIEALIQAGVTALKIEGRMRSPEYVGVVAKEFRQQIRYVLDKKTPDRMTPSVDTKEKGNIENLLLAFNRGGGFTDHYLAGKKRPDMIAGAHTGSFGVLLGEIAAKNAQIGVIDIRKTPEVTASQFPNKGDVFAIRRKGREEEIASAPIGSAVANGMNIRIKGFHPAMIDTMQIGDQVYRMTHSQLGKEVLASEKSKTMITGVLREEKQKIVLEWTVTQGIAKGIGFIESMESDSESRSIPEQRCVEQLSKTGGTPFAIDRIRIEAVPAIQVSALNLLRRESLAGLAEKIRQSFKRSQPDPDNCDPVTEIATATTAIVASDATDTHASVGAKMVLPAVGCATDAFVSKVEKSPEFHDYSAVEELIRQMDIFTPQSQQSQQSAQPLHQISAYFYAWDGDAASIACNADWYELPIWAFMKKNALAGLKRLKEIEPDTRFAVAIPPAYIGPVRKVILDLLQTLAKEGIEAVVSGNPGNAWLCRELALEDFQDAGSNVINSSTASLLKEFGATSIVPSIELSMEPLLLMTQNVFAGSDCIVELPAYGKLRLMYSEHCPVGYNRSGCKACETGAAFAMKDRKGVSFPVICHKESCTVDILNGDNLCVPAEIAELANCCPLRARLIFTDETQEERQALVDGFRTLLSHPDSPTQNRDIEKIRQTAVAIASDRNHGLTKGHYQRGMH